MRKQSYKYVFLEYARDGMIERVLKNNVDITQKKTFPYNVTG